MTGVVVAVRPMVFKKEQVLTPEMLRAAFEVIDKNHPAAKAAIARARSGKIEGTAMMALDAGDQSAGSILRGIELLMKGDLNPAANQFGVALRNAPDAPIASFFLGACYAAAGRDKEAVSAWERARAAKLQLPALQVILADGLLRLGQPADALEPLREALDRQPQNDDIRRNLAVAQSHLGLHEQAYPTIVPFLDRNPNDADALMIALHALYQVHIEGKTIGSADEDKAKAATYARAYADCEGAAGGARGEVGGVPEPVRPLLEAQRESKTLRLEHVLEPADDFLLRLHAYQTIDLLAVFQHEQRRDAAYAEAVGDAGILVDVQLRHFHAPGQFRRELVDRRRQHVARPAPVGPHVEQHRRRASLDLCRECRVGHFDGPAGAFRQRRSCTCRTPLCGRVEGEAAGSSSRRTGM